MADPVSRSDASSIHTLRDGTKVRLRPIGPADRDRLAAGFEKLSATSRYRRFLSPTPRLTEETLRHLTATDGWNHLAIGAETEQGDGLGVARFFRLESEPEVAEAAVAVIDEKQGLGLGHLLLEALVAAARERGIRRFRGYVLPENEPMRALLAEIGERATVRRERDLLFYDVLLPESRAEEIRQGPLYAVLRLAARGVETILRTVRGRESE
ncbi:MAG: GNAT family N-acetyltransferase [Candidatus Binatia bacterium]